MKVLGCGAIVTATIKITIGEIRKDGRGAQVYDSHKTENGKKFWTFIPGHVVKKLKVGDTIVVTCTPTPDLSFATDTLIVTKMTGPKSAVQIYNRTGDTPPSMDIFD